MAMMVMIRMMVMKMWTRMMMVTIIVTMIVIRAPVPVRHDSRPWSKRQTPPGQLCPTALDGPWGSILVIFNDIRTTQKY